MTVSGWKQYGWKFWPVVPATTVGVFSDNCNIAILNLTAIVRGRNIESPRWRDSVNKKRYCIKCHINELGLADKEFVLSLQYKLHVSTCNNKPNDVHKCSTFIKEKYLSKALTCMKIFLYKQELLFCQGDGYFWPHCCKNNLYISHRSLYAPTFSFWAIRSMLISLFRVTSWFETVNNAVTRWMNLRQNHLHEHDLQLFDYNV